VHTSTASGRRATGRSQRSAVRNAMSGRQRLSVLVAKMTAVGNRDAVLHPRRAAAAPQMTVHRRRPVGTGSASVVWLTLGALCALVGIATVRRRRPSGP
jgi:hypothetical protein